MIRPMVMAHFIMQTVMYMKVNGSMTRQTVRASIIMLMAQITTVHGETISSMVLVLKDGLMVLFMKASITRARRMERVS